MTRYPNDVLTAAQWWYDRGATVVPASTYRKGPRVADWQRLPREDLRELISRGDNLALRTGDGSLADIDFDDDFAARARRPTSCRALAWSSGASAIPTATASINWRTPGAVTATTAIP